MRAVHVHVRVHVPVRVRVVRVRVHVRERSLPPSLSKTYARVYIPPSYT